MAEKVTDREILLRFHEAQDEYDRTVFHRTDLAGPLKITSQQLGNRLADLEKRGFVESTHYEDVEWWKIANIDAVVF